MDKVKRVEVRGPCRLFVEFEDGVSGEIDLADSLVGPMGQPLRDASFFAQLFIDEFGVVSWPNGFDLAPDRLHDRLQSESTPQIQRASPLPRRGG